MVKIPQEQFKYQETLADLGVQIAKGRATLSELKVNKEKYFKIREDETLVRLNELLKRSRDVLKEVDANQEELTTYKTLLTSFASELLAHKSSLDIQLVDFEKRQTEFNKQIDEASQALQQETVRMVILKEQIKGEKQGILIQKTENLKAEEHILSQQKALKTAFALLKEKQIKE